MAAPGQDRLGKVPASGVASQFTGPLPRNAAHGSCYNYASERSLTEAVSEAIDDIVGKYSIT